MELHEQFNSQWHGIRDAVLSEAMRELALHGRVDADVLTAKLLEETGGWRQGVLAQGLWYKEFLGMHPENAVLFAEKAQNMHIYQPANNRKPSNGWVYLLFVVAAFMLGLVFHYKTEMNTLEQIFYPILFVFIAHTMYVPIKNNREKKHFDDVTEDLRSQLDAMQQELASFIE